MSEAMERGLRKKPTPLISWSCSFSFQNHEKINFWCLSHSGVCYNSPKNLLHNLWGKPLFANRLKQNNFLDKNCYLTKHFSPKKKLAVTHIICIPNKNITHCMLYFFLFILIEVKDTVSSYSWKCILSLRLFRSLYQMLPFFYTWL